MLYAIVAVLSLIVDQAVKYWTTANIVLNTGEKELIPGFIHLVNVHNDGAAFSILEGKRWFFVLLCVVFVAAVIVLLAKNIIKSAPARWTAVLVVAGAVGNCIDRIISGYVVDMFEFEFLIFGWQFPVFNVADILITVCGILFCIFFLMEPVEKKSGATEMPAKAPAAPAGKPQAKEAPAKAAKPANTPARRRKLEIPDFPAHPHTGQPAIDPNDPFAEWERIAAAKEKAAAPAPAAAQQPVPAAEPAPQVQVREIKSPEEPTAKRPAVRVEETVVPPAAPKAQPKADAAPQEDVSYNLDDILAEFRDL